MGRSSMRNAPYPCHRSRRAVQAKNENGEKAALRVRDAEDAVYDGLRGLERFRYLRAM